MRGIGYRTAAARSMAGKALKIGGLGAAIAVGSDLLGIGGGQYDGDDEGYSGGESPGRLTSGGLLALAAAVAAAGRAADSLDIPVPKIASALRGFAGFAGRGSPPGFIGGALLGYLLSYLAYYAANRGSGITPAFGGFLPVLDCDRNVPAGRDPIGNPAACDILQVADRGLYDPYVALELASGFQTQWKYLPVVNRWTTVTKYSVAGGGATSANPTGVDQRPYSDEMIGAGYYALQGVTEVNPWPDDEAAHGPIPVGPGVKPFRPAIPPSVDAEAMPIGTVAPNPNTLTLPYRLVVARKDAGNPTRVMPYGWTAGPRPGEFPPVAVPTPITAPAVTVDDRGNQNPDRVNPNMRVVGRVHERKVKAASQGAAQQAYMQMFGAVTEIGEFIDSIYDALPEKIRQGDFFANGRHELGRDKKLWSIYQNYKAINVDAMVKNIVFNNLQDAVIGKASRDITSMSGGSPIGRTLGLF